MSLLTTGLSILDTVLDRVIPDRNARAEAKELLANMEQAGELRLLFGQLEVNKQEAAHSSVFVSGWRPAVGWICAAGMGYNFVVYPLLKFIVVVYAPEVPELPVLESGELMTLLLGMLGLAGYRTFEKREGVAKL